MKIPESQVTAGKLILSLRLRLSLFEDFAFVAAAAPESLLLGVPCRVLRTAVSIFFRTIILLQRYALAAADLTTSFLLVSFLFFALSAPSSRYSTKPLLPRAAYWALFGFGTNELFQATVLEHVLLPKQSSYRGALCDN